MQLHSILLAALLASTLPTHAATCRAASAAQIGAQNGYERDRKAAEAWSQRENQVSSGLQQCLGDISTAITVPTFPDLSGILNGIKDKICRAAHDKIQEYIPSQIDPWLAHLPVQSMRQRITHQPLTNRSLLLRHRHRNPRTRPAGITSLVVNTSSAKSADVTCSSLQPHRA
jgi:hypothetical protein